MKKLLFLTLCLALNGSIVFAQKPSFTRYIKPGFQGVSALALFCTSYLTGQFAYLSGKLAHEMNEDSKKHKNSLANLSDANQVVAHGFDFAATMAASSVAASASIACATSGILGVIAAKSAYKGLKGIKKIK